MVAVPILTREFDVSVGDVNVVEPIPCVELDNVIEKPAVIFSKPEPTIVAIAMLLLADALGVPALELGFAGKLINSELGK